MAFHRRATLAALALLAFAGCHAGNSGTLASKAEGPQTKDNITVDRFIADYNRNAAAVRSLQAEPGIEVTGEKIGKLNGQLAFERSKNFRLELSYGIHTQVADIGSNDTGFWFWVSGDKKDNAIYVCDYEHIQDTQLAVTLQPDWIIEAMGLREFTERDAATIDSRPGDTPTTMILTQIRKDPRSREKVFTKETVIDVEKGYILEHKLYSGMKKTLLSRATVIRYMPPRPLPPTEANPEGLKVILPAQFRLEWIEEKFSMVVTMNPNKVKINPAIDASARAELFSEPTIKNASRVDLARQGVAQAGGAGPSSRVHETMPSPRSGSTIQLGQPDSSVIEGDRSYRRPAAGAPPPMPAPTSTDIRPDAMSGLGIVGAPLPGSVGPTPARTAASSGWGPSRSAQ